MTAGVTDANAQYSAVYGSKSFGAITNFTQTNAGAVVSVGGNNFPLVTDMGGTVAIGANICPGLVTVGNTGANVVIGMGACGNVNSVQSAFNSSVIIGFNAYRCTSATTAQDQSQNVIIGAFACAAGGPGGTGSITNNVVIGTSAASSLAGQSSENVFIGDSVAASVIGGAVGNVVIGGNSNISGNNVTGNTIIGSGCGITASNYATVLGGNIGFSGNSFVGGIAIGYGAGTAGFAVGNDQFVIETFYSAVKKTILYGYMTRGTLIVGNSTNTVNRDIADSLNALKLLSGAPSGVAPVGGGYFYFNAASGLHFISPSGADTVLAPI